MMVSVAGVLVSGTVCGKQAINSLFIIDILFFCQF